MVVIDFSNALDAVNHAKLLKGISNTVKCLVVYLRGRLASCWYNDATFVCHTVRRSVCYELRVFLFLPN